jgi:hypothetical protein
MFLEVDLLQQLNAATMTYLTNLTENKQHIHSSTVTIAAAAAINPITSTSCN